MKTQRIFPVLYWVSAAALVAFSFLVQVLTMDRYLAGSYDHFLWRYADALICAFLALLALGGLYRFLGRFPRLRKRLVALATLLLIIWNLNLLGDTLSFYDRDMTEKMRTANGNLVTVRTDEAIWELYGHCRLFGEGTPLLRYPEPEELRWQQEGLRPYAIEERKRLNAVFSNWAQDCLFPMLSLYYGYWVGLLYLVPVLLWTVSVVAGWRRIPRSRSVLYLSCALPLGALIWGPLLGAAGLVRYNLGFLFTDIPCTFLSWQALLWGGLLQMALLGCLLLLPEPQPGLSLWQKLQLCDRILMEEAELSPDAGTK